MDLFELSGLESLNISNNSIINLDKISVFQNLKELIASNNKISSIPESIKELTYLETLRLDGNPICVSNPGLSSCFGKDVGREITKFFKAGDTSPVISSSGGGFLDSGINDAAAL